ncbi:hypothetical protein [Paracoccus marinaquae]|uniref:Flagellar protein FliT n=1 Tax=Paracoccus marinaquae TaxID=2841926 RepID=A0ABS6AHQ6_9RHOB|nr:hypothetical protein [Paracoccus marinaquae]MBU3029200.1 hypothetical protein [Paracoccus marinaquae]
MSARLMDKLAAAKSAVIAGQVDRALALIGDFADLATRTGIPAAERARFEARLAELRVLAEASQQGAQRALEDVRAIIQAARSLQTYDDNGRRQTAVTAAPPPHRF